MEIVPDDGALSARIALVGEAAGREEERLRRPFVGPSGKLLTKWWAAAGLRRQDIYITNVLPYRPPKTGKPEEIPPNEIALWIDDLWYRLSRLTDVYVVVACGALALSALLPDKRGILKHRGSVYTIKLGDKQVKVIPTVHPAASFREPFLERPCRLDWIRIAEQAKTHETAAPERDFITHPSEDDVVWACERMRRASVVAIDIETPRTVTWEQTILKNGKPGKPKRVLGEPIVACVGLSDKADFAISVPFGERYWGSKKRSSHAIACVRAVCESEAEKVLQNGLFDAWWLWREHAIAIRNYRWDLKAMHHCLDSADAHDLAYMASVDTYEPYWKDEAKDPDEISKYADDFSAFATYNCKDAAVERELFDVYHERLRREGLLGVYIAQYRNMFSGMLAMSLGGVAVDAAKRAALADEFKARAEAVRASIAALAGMELYGQKALSPKKLAVYLYETLRLPKQYMKNSRGEAALTTREVAVRKLMRKHPAKLEIVGAMILEQRRVQQLSTFVAESRVDADGRIRSSYGFSPETGRLSSTRAPNRRGANMQNQDREIRSMFVPDKGCVFLEVDYSQGESRIVAAYTGDRDLVRLARMAPGEFDEHREIAAVLFGCVACDVTADQRYIGKRVNHASNYGMHGKKLAEELSKDGYTFEDDECEVFIQKVLARKPAIVEWQRRVRMEVMRRRALTNAFGNTTRFPYERLCDDLYRRAYAYKPQSSLAKLLNLYGFVPCVRWIAKEGAEAAVAAHLHDALLVSVAPAWAYDLASFLVESMEVEIDYEGVALTIPVSVKVGNRWGEGVKFERMVERDEFERRCESVFASVDGGGAALEGGDGLRQAGDRAGMA